MLGNNTNFGFSNRNKPSSIIGSPDKPGSGSGNRKKPGFGPDSHKKPGFGPEGHKKPGFEPDYRKKPGFGPGNRTKPGFGHSNNNTASESFVSGNRNNSGLGARQNKKLPETDYRVYILSRKEWAIAAGAYGMLTLAVGLLFFNSVLASLLLSPGFYFFWKEYRESLLAQRKRMMQIQFLDGMQMTATALQAGYSIENAWKEARKELQKIYRPDSFIVREFSLLCAQIDMSRTSEELLASLGRRSGVEEIQSFAEIFETTRRTGGDLLRIIRTTVSSMRQRQDTLAEIETSLSGKVMEQNIMSIMPLGILGYVRLTSPEFLEPVYGNLPGILVMSICLGVYGAAFLWGRSIVKIEV